MEDLINLSGVFVLLIVRDVRQKPALQQPRKLQYLQLQYLLIARQQVVMILTDSVCFPLYIWMRHSAAAPQSIVKQRFFFI